MTPEQITADTLYQRAILRVYGPWLDSEVITGAERRRARSRVQHARLMLTMRNAEAPRVEFNRQDADQQAAAVRTLGATTGASPRRFGPTAADAQGH